ncbi:MAG: cupin domain-containing protein [Actinomycetota bacterium]|nr:cupin domain-containing protein [Actinomycetota bacterium]
MARSAAASGPSFPGGRSPGGSSGRNGLPRDGVGPAPAWEPIVGAIGPKVRELRQQLGLSLQQLASRADVSAAAIHKVERNDMVPTITTLLKLAAALGRPIGHFVDAAPGQVQVAAHTPATGRSMLPAPAPGVELAGVGGPPERFRAAGAVATLAPGAESGAEVAPRPGEELLLVLDGTLAIEVAGERYTLRKGDALHYPTDHRHRWSNPGRRTARVVRFSLRGS